MTRTPHPQTVVPQHARTRPSGRRRPQWLTSLVPIVCVVLAGCSGTASDSDEAAPAWEAQVTHIASTTDNDFVRDVADDGEITKAEMDEVFARLKQCMADKGYDDLRIIATDQSYSYNHTVVYGEPEDGDNLTECQKSSGDFELTPLYSQIWANPQHLDLDEARRQCLLDAGLVGEDFTTTQAHDAYFDFNTTGESGLSSDGDQTEQCLNNPTGADAMPTVDEPIQ